MGSTEISKKKNIEKAVYGTTNDGKKIYQYKLTNTSGMSVSIIEYGGIITNIEVPDRNGAFADVVLGHDNLSDYEVNNNYFGCIVGRFGNRIANGEFILDGTTYKLFQNNNDNSLHGGQKGFDKQVWATKPFEDGDNLGVELTYTSPDGEEGYPGNLSCKVIYTLTPENALIIDYEANTDKTTIINLTNHTYFNLKDGGISDILDHELQINASHYTPVDDELIPTGELSMVTSTPFDFRNPTTIGKRINENHPQLQLGIGYDHNYVLDKEPNELALIARAFEKESGRILEVLTTEPGVQFYSGNFLNGENTGKDGILYASRSGFCLETQHFPDSPNQPEFPSTVLQQGETFKSTTIYQFGVEDSQ